jgi:hypothetical protein
MGRIVNRAVMGFLDNVKKRARQAKLQGQCLLLERETTAAQQQLGVDLFTLLSGVSRRAAQQSPSATTTADDEMNDFPGLQAMFTAAWEDIEEWVAKRQDRDAQRDELEAAQDHLLGDDAHNSSKPPRTAASWMSNNASRAKLTAEIAYYDREIYLRQQIFGIQVATELDLVARPLSDNNALPNNELVRVLRDFQDAVQAILRRKQAYESEIAALSGTGAPAENQSLVLPDESAEDDNGLFLQEQSNSESLEDENL